MKKAEEEECNQSRFVLSSITSFLTIRRVSERDIQMGFSGFQPTFSQDSNAAAFLRNKLNVLLKQLQTPPQIAIKSTKYLCFT